MKCSKCGAYNEDYMEYCENCAAPLTADPESAPESPQQSSEDGQASWGFVRAPRWIQPEFDANTISEDDIPADYDARRVPPSAPVQPPMQPPIQQAPAFGQAPVYTQAPAYGSAPVNAPVYGAPAYGGAQSAVPPQQNAAFHKAPAFGAPQGQARYGAPADDFAPAAPQAPYGANEPRDGVKFADPIDDDYYGFDATASGAAKAKRYSKKSGKAKRGGKDNSQLKTILFWGAAGLLVVLIIVFTVIFFINRSKDDKPAADAPATQSAQTDAPASADTEKKEEKAPFLGGLFSKSPITKPATIEEGVTQDGDPAYIITVYAKNKSTVRFTAGSLVKENPIKDGSLKLRIPKEIWIPDEPVDAATIEVYPDITVISKDGEETPVEFSDPIIIALPAIDLTLSDPTTANVTTMDGNVNVAGMVGDTTAEVFVNETQLYLDESGNFAGTYTVTQPGMNEVNVEARKNGYQIARKTFSAELSTAPAATDPAAANPGATTPAASGAIPTNATAVAYVTTDDLNVRDTAAPSGNALGQLPLCTKVYVIAEDAGNGWAKIVYNNSEAYCSAQYLRIVSPAADYRTTTATVNTDNLKLRSTSSTSGEILTQLANGTSISFIKDAGSDWSMVENNGLIGYVATQYISK
ncbi:MAG: SH3 domain-containing protein [Eubacteriales bacterium]|nr:SH3 domain-containing protein [Eubacteriales bacterium]